MHATGDVDQERAIIAPVIVLEETFLGTLSASHLQGCKGLCQWPMCEGCQSMTHWAMQVIGGMEQETTIMMAVIVLTAAASDSFVRS